MPFRRHAARTGPEPLASFAARARHFIAQHLQPGAEWRVETMPVEGVWASGPAISAQDRTIVVCAEGYPGSDGYPRATIYAPSTIRDDLAARIGVPSMAIAASSGAGRSSIMPDLIAEEESLGLPNY